MKFNRWLRDAPFSRNVITLLAGGASAQLISLAAAPILARIYSPSDFGIFAFYIAVAGLLATLVPLRYELAIMLPEGEEEAANVAAAALAVTGAGCIVMELLAVLAHGPLMDLLGRYEMLNVVPRSDLSNCLYLLPFVSMVGGSLLTLQAWLNRHKRYQMLAGVRMAQAVSTTLFLIGLAWAGWGVWGLVLGGLVGEFVVASVLAWHLGLPAHPIRASRVWQLIRKHRAFPFYMAPTTCLNLVSLQIVVFVLGWYYSPEAVGFFSMAQRILNGPLQKLSGSFFQVFSREVVVRPDKVRFYLRSLAFNLGLFVVITSPILLAGPKVFSIVLGQRWLEAGSAAQILCLAAVTYHALGSVNFIFAVGQQNWLLFLWQAFYLVGAAALLVYLHQLPIAELLLYYSLFATSANLLMAGLGVASARRAMGLARKV